MSLTAEEIAGLAGDAHVLDADGRRVGRVRHVYDSDRSGGLSWVTLDDPGHPGRPLRFVPLQGARLDGPNLRLAYADDLVDRSPAVADHDVISSTEEQQLRAHYGLDAATDSGSGFTMTRSEQRLAVGTRVEATERVRVHKYIVTEEVTHTFTLRREEIRIERQPLTGPDSTPAASGAAFADAVEEIVLYAEVPVLGTRVVPVEIVRLSTHTVTAQEAVSADLQSERIEVEHSTTGV